MFLLKSKRESSKTARKQKILVAARTLLDENGLSMRSLALEAGVSLKTPYNLFGSKHNLLTCLMDTDLEDYRKKVEKLASKDPIQKIYDSLDLAIDIYRREETFYKGLFFAALDSKEKSLMPAFLKPRILFWEARLSEAIAHNKVKNKGLIPSAYGIDRKAFAI